MITSHHHAEIKAPESAGRDQNAGLPNSSGELSSCGGHYLAPLAALIDPKLFFFCVILAFTACCLAGYMTTLKNQYADKLRFGQLLSPEAFFSPTFSQMRAIAKARANKEKIVVVIGGDSVLNGTGQPEAKLWSQKLQQLLGDRYVVLNFAMRAGTTFEAGYLVAESLTKDFKKLIFIADTEGPGYCRRAELARFDHLYFDGLYKGYLLPNAAREQDVEMRIRMAPDAEKSDWQELDLRKRLDGIFYFDDLWTTLAYRRFHTVWSSLALENFTKPRREYADNEGETPLLAARRVGCSRDGFDFDKDNLRLLKRDTDGRWVIDEGAWQNFEKQIHIIPVEMRKRSIIVHIHNCPWLERKISPQAQAGRALMYRESVERWQRAGYRSMQIGENFTDEDYHDRVHLTPAGGAKLADRIALSVRELAENLGYTQ